MQETETIQAREIELRKAVQCLWIDLIATGIMSTGFVALFFIPTLRTWQMIIPIGIAALLFLRRALATRKAVEGMRLELTEAKQQSVFNTSETPGSWPPPPRRPSV